MFNVTPNDILQLNDEQLRELVARLAAAEAQRHGYSPLCVTWGGSQTAPDGGLDVRVDLPSTAALRSPALPRPVTGYQVKKEDMPKGKINAEMRLGGKLRPVLSELAKMGGAYIIVSATGSTAALRLDERRKAMRDALHDCSDTTQFHTDFFDRRRIADWVDEHPGMVLWVREKVGRRLDGWSSYGPWSSPDEPEDAPYLVDNRLRIHLGPPDTPDLSVEMAITRLRHLLACAKGVVRLVGLSGVGKTRLVQALFDDRIGENALPKAEAIYTDLNANPTPQPTSLANDLIALRRRAILIVDNCGSGLHNELAKVCSKTDSNLSLITVEYDVSEDLPERTQVVNMTTASTSLIERLVVQRNPGLSEVDAETIAIAADGNARIALAIAGAVKASDNVARLTNKEIFGRLFWQRHGEDTRLLRSAQTLALVYSFESELDEGKEAELPRLARLVDHSIDGMRRDIVELERRILMQRRANWRAVLPHALANHLAERALEEIPGKRIREQIVNSGNARLLRSFTRRLSYLHTHGIAREFCEEWLKPGGMLADVRKLDSFGCDMFNYAASVTPAYALAALERVGNLPRQEAIAIWDSFAEVLRSIAYDAALFDRCVALLLHVISHRSKHPPDHIRTLLVSFFQISHSGTHAPVIKRFGLISDWLTSATPAVQELGKVALQQALSAQISVRYGFTFGARSRDFGYAPRTPEESADWYRHGLLLLDQLKSEGGKRAEFARHLLAKTFPRLWGYQLLRGDLTSRMRSYTNGSFWMEGLAACRHALAKYAGDDISKAELEDLYSQLAPNDLTSKVLALLARSGPPFNGRQPGESQQAYSQRTCESSESLGEQVADNPNVLARVAPMIFRTGDQYERFGLGLGKATPDLATTWRVLMNAWSDHPRKRDPALLCGFLAAMALRDTTLAQQCLNECLTDGSLTKALPAIQNALGWDEAGIARLSKATDSNSIPVKEYRHLYGAARAPAPVRQAATDLLTKIAAVPHGFIVAAQVLNMWHAVAEINGPEEVDYLRPVSREVLRYAAFDNSYGADYDLGLIAELALAGSESESLAQELIWKLRRGAQRNWWPTSNRTLLETLFRLHPMATLTALYEGKKEEQEAAIELLSSSPISSGHPAKLLDPTVLAAWCEADKAKRSAFAIEIIPIVEPAKTSGLAHLTLHARTLLEKCPSPEILLDRIVERLLKRGWDSLSVMESNATALDDMLDMFDAHFRASVQRNKTQLLEKLAAFREQETQRHRVRDERFE